MQGVYQLDKILIICSISEILTDKLAVFVILTLDVIGTPAASDLSLRISYPFESFS